MQRSVAGSSRFNWIYGEWVGGQKDEFLDGAFVDDYRKAHTVIGHWVAFVFLGKGRSIWMYIPLGPVKNTL